ncbi:DUF456 domain-containing protein [Desmospora profundinema]|uniref:Uncharacterized protein YqgC (DUF456 family) n=1 Tax=Desmospora profundinema TaxID=1571184 RepID=A0ABU1IHW6_9BACL|nr:DUF456 family protein [Desmospora profundinema]MDR6224286.1 uncharacterized protein YqgC (DUF456 family) [Desmospora profundinema]
MELLWWLLIVLCFMIGFAGLFVPVVPDTPMLLAGFGIAHFFVDPEALPLSFWVAAGLITLASMAVDYIAGGIAAKTSGGTNVSVLASVLGAIGFTILLAPFGLGLVGLLFGPMLAVVLVELIQGKSAEQALKVGFATLVGFLGGIFVKGLLMAGLIIWFMILMI